MIIDLLVQHSYWTFLCLGLVLLIIELFGTNGYSLWSGVAALIVGVIAWCFPALSSAWLWSLFALLTVIVAYSWWRWTQKGLQYNKQNTLNQGGRDLIGRQSVLTKTITSSELGRIKIGDSSWLAKSETPVAVDKPILIGTTVEIVDVQSTLLIVKPID